MTRFIRETLPAFNGETAADLIAVGLFCAMLLNWSAILTAIRSAI